MRLIEAGIDFKGEAARLVCYIRSEEHITQGREDKRAAPRPFVLIVPGGGYHDVCEREGEPVALAFLNKGFNAAVLYYSVDTVCFPVALAQLANAVDYVRRNAGKLNADPSEITLFGASAGGHLACSLGVFWNSDFLQRITGLSPERVRPNSLILSYPVITSGEKAHKNSFKYLLKEKVADAEALSLVSLEKQVTRDMPPAFIWATRTDTYVPVENSLLLASAMQREGLEYELHIYPGGEHGASLCTDETIMTGDISEYSHMAGWFDDAVRFLKGLNR